MSVRSAFVILGLVGLMASSCGYSTPSGPSFTPVPSGPNTVLVPSGTYQGGTTGFTPGTLTVPAGTTVVFGNNDITQHTSSSDDGKWDSGNIDSGNMFSVKLDTPGTYQYHCNIHSFMHGTIVVQ
jgi:plastocyanin